MESQVIILTLCLLLALIIVIYGVRKGLRESSYETKNTPRMEEQVAPIQYDESSFMPMGGLMPVDPKGIKPPDAEQNP